MQNKDYRLELRVKNNNILKRIEENGYSSIADFCKKNKKNEYLLVVYDFINLKRKALGEDSKYHPVVKWMAKILQCKESDLFSPYQLVSCLESNKNSIEVEEAEAIHALEQKDRFLLPDQLIEQKQNEKITNDVLRSLPPREEQILRMRFGFGGENPLMYDQIGDYLDITGGRVRQIEARALRMLRHPSRTRRFQE
jgi:RNA polymerase sigma factor (sigma-70 family)